MISLKDFIWGKLTDYIHENDSYKDNQGKGLLQRFLSIFGLELDEETMPMLEGIINELDPETATDEFLSLIAYQVGNPLDVLEDTQVYRNLLTQIISIYKVKGTTKSYQMLFALLGYSITLEEYFPPDNLYDNDQIYDGGAESEEVEGGNQTYYDLTSCDMGCTDYSITYSDLPGFTNGELTEDQRERLITAIKLYLEPINAKLKDLDYAA